MSNLPPPTGYSDTHTDIVDLLETARPRRMAARSVNALMTASYCEIGRRIIEFEQGGEGRAIYGEALIKRLAVDLTHRFGRGLSKRNIEQMRQFYLRWPIAQTVSAKYPDLPINSSRATTKTMNLISQKHF